MLGVNAQSVKGHALVQDLKVEKANDSLYFSMKIDAGKVELKANHEMALTPLLIAGDQCVTFPQVILMGRNQYIYYLRKEQALSPYVYRTGKVEIIQYQQVIPFEEWMRTAELVMQDNMCGCNDQVLMDNRDMLAKLDFVPKTFEPTFVYQKPVIEEKHREVKGSAFIDFQVSRTEIVEDFRNNKAELCKIFNTIDSVKSDPDVFINSVLIKGFASPDGSYKNNERLAKGRTESLKAHVQHLYAFSSDMIHTDYEAEDWDGLRAYVESSSLTHKDEILELIDSDLDPDKKEWKIKSSFPNDYKQLKKVCYPSLRHSDYAVDYTVRAYTDVEDAKRVMRVRPGNLSLHEFYQVAESYTVGSEEYNQTFEMMAQIYPTDPVANLNAANVAMARGDLDLAAKFLESAGKSAEADYARGVYYGLKGDYASAKRYLSTAKEAGIHKAVDALEQINEIEND